MAKTTSEELVLITPQQIELITETIETKLAAQNVTDQAIAKYKKDALALKIDGPDDVAGYKAVYEMRQKGKKTRILAAQICKAGREPLQAEVALWIEKETQIRVAIKEGEQHLQAEEDGYTAAKQKIEDEKNAAIESRLKERDTVLVSLGARCNGVDYYLDELRFPLSVVKNAENSYFNDDILYPFAKLFEAKDQIRIANEKALKEQKEQEEKERKEREEKEKREREELEKQQKELREQQAKIKAEQDKIERQKEAALKAKVKNRSEELEALGFIYSMHHEKYMFKGVLSIDPEALSVYDEDDWSKLIEETKPKIEEYQAILKKKTDEELARLNQEAIEKAERERKEQEEQNKVRKQEELDKATDKQKVGKLISIIKDIEIPEVKSRYWRSKVSIIREKFEEIINL